MKQKKTKKKMASPDKVKGKRIDIEVTLPLSDKAKIERGERAAQLMNERDELELERKSMNERYKSRTKAMDAEAKKLLDEFSTGRETANVSALEVKNFDKNIVEYHFKGKVVKTREMTFGDRQENLPLKDKNEKAEAKTTDAKADQSAASKEATEHDKAKACVATPGKKPPRGQRQELPNPDERDLDIAATHREETSRNGSYSALNGARA